MRSVLGTTALACAAVALTGALGSPASAGTTNPRTGHFDIEAVVTCTPGTNTVVTIETDIDVDEGAGAAWVPATDYVDLGHDELAGSGNVIGLHPEYVNCTGTPSVAFRLVTASGPGVALATDAGSTRFRSSGNTVTTAGPYSVTTHTDFDNITYSATGFYNWTFRATAGGINDTAPRLTVRAS